MYAQVRGPLTTCLAAWFLFAMLITYAEAFHNGWKNTTRIYGNPYSVWTPPKNISGTSNLWLHKNTPAALSYPKNITPSKKISNDTVHGEHKFVWGNKASYDRLLYYSRVKKSSSFMRIVTVDLDFPAKYQRPNGTISYIQILDQKPVGRGGYASVLRGGVGYKNVTIHFTSQRNHGLDFTVSIYGH